ncbi:MAG: FeoB-associated Cys-rich membrane protein [Myxococcota bacterium]
MRKIIVFAVVAAMAALVAFGALAEDKKSNEPVCKPSCESTCNGSCEGSCSEAELDKASTAFGYCVSECKVHCVPDCISEKCPQK